jgi:hypothetical protein
MALTKATEVTQEQYRGLLMGLQAFAEGKWWKVQQIVFVGGACGSIHVESFNKNMKSLGGEGRNNTGVTIENIIFRPITRVSVCFQKKLTKTSCKDSETPVVK